MFRLSVSASENNDNYAVFWHELQRLETQATIYIVMKKKEVIRDAIRTVNSQFLLYSQIRLLRRHMHFVQGNQQSGVYVMSAPTDSNMIVLTYKFFWAVC